MPQKQRRKIHRRPVRRKARAKTSAIVQIAPPQERPWMLTLDEITILKNSICKGSTDDELKFCLTVARRYKLDPFKQQIWFIRRWNSDADNGQGGKGAYVWVAQVGIYGMAHIAARDHWDYGSISLPEYGPMIKLSVEGKEIVGPEWARVKIFKKGIAEPTVGEAYFEEYCPKKYINTLFWRTMGRRMIAKCAKAQGIREAYPDLGGLYIPEEMERINSEYTKGGRAIVEAGEFGTVEAAQAVAKQKVAAHENGKPIESQPDEPPQDTITAIPWKQGRLALSGTGLNVLKSELDPEALKELGILLSVADRVTHMPSGNWFLLEDRATKCGIKATLEEAHVAGR